MEGLPVKIGGLALVVVALAALAGGMLPSGGVQPTQKERILAQAKPSGASNVRIRAAEAEAARPQFAPPPNLSPPVVLSSGVEEIAPGQASSVTNGYSGMAPVPQTQFAEPTSIAPGEDVATSATEIPEE